MLNKTSNKTDKKSDVYSLVEKKINYFQDLIQKTTLYIHKNKIMDIISIGDETSNINLLHLINSKLKILLTELNATISSSSSSLSSLTNISNELIENLQIINNDLSVLFKNIGTETLEDLLTICFGNPYTNSQPFNELERNKFDLLKKYFHPIGYKISSKNTDKDKDKNSDSETDTDTETIICSPLASQYKTKSFHIKLHGMQISIINHSQKKNIIIYGYTEDPIIDFFNNKYISQIINQFTNNVPKTPAFTSKMFEYYVKCLKMRDLFIIGNNINTNTNTIYDEFYGMITNLNSMKQKPISVIIKDFMTSDTFIKRKTILNLMLDVDNESNTYLAYILYDLLPTDNNVNIDNHEQTIIFDSFSWDTKILFKDVMSKTIQHMSDIINTDNSSKISLEQQICLMKAPENVKERALQKLKEIKSKSDDSGSKARQYLDGLLKIPFGFYKVEPILYLMSTIKADFMNLIEKHKFIIDTTPKPTYNNLEIITHLKKFKTQLTTLPMDEINMIISDLDTYDKPALLHIIDNILKTDSKTYNNKNGSIKIEFPKPIVKKTATKKLIKEYIQQTIEFSVNTLKNTDIVYDMFDIKQKQSKDNPSHSDCEKDIQLIETKYNEIQKYMTSVRSVLNVSVHGHDNAKNQIEQIIGQWINGEQSGYCFGFEGPPGVGKTSLAKRGLSECLKDADGVSRPFAMIQMGGDSNGSSLHGHNYTYVGSTWGSIVQILMDKKCMNPIIFIDEIDKISKTEHGREIIGILTHLLDATQNDCFQDKYFSGIDLDLSKALFILSYNDVDSIDRILLDRIHRIKFAGLTIEDKLTICEVHILPEIYTKIGLKDTIEIKPDVLKFIIEEYTLEPGVRKLKEILFEIISEINLDILKHFNTSYTIPISITANDIKNKYFKNKRTAKTKKIHSTDEIGIINGLWANSMGSGGVIPIQVKWRPHEVFLGLHLTGSQGDSMKQSMDVAATLAWNLTSIDTRAKIMTSNYKNNDNLTANIIQGHYEGLHIHAGDISTSKDGPSATGAIAVAIYSLFNQRKIKHNIAMTGEGCLSGKITEIGGLDLKILGAIKAGITEIIFPTENLEDYDKFMDKYKDNKLIEGIKFYPVSTIEEVFELVFINC